VQITFRYGFTNSLWTLARKLKQSQRPMRFVTPCRWLADGAKQSTLMRDWPITVIPHTVDTAVWQPWDKALARQLLKTYISFGKSAY